MANWKNLFVEHAAVVYLVVHFPLLIGWSSFLFSSPRVWAARVSCGVGLPAVARLMKRSNGFA